MSQLFTIIEIEFTGMNLKTDHILEIAMVKHNGKKIIERYHSLVNPSKEISPFLLALTGLSQKKLDKAPFFEDIAEAILNFTEDTILAGINIRRTYALLKREFKRYDRRFQRKHICVSQLIEQHFNTTHPKTMSSVCRDLNIPYSNEYSLKKKVSAGSKVFKKLFIEGKKDPKLEKKRIHQSAMAAKFPIHVPHEKVAALPNAVGVYYFLDHKGRIVYLGKSKNIRSRVLQHFNSDLDSFDKHEMKDQIYDLQYRLTGSELIALLLESDEIKRYMPKFNRAQRRRRYRYGVYMDTDEMGWKNLNIDILRWEQKPLKKFNQHWHAVSFILNQAFQFQISLPSLNIKELEQWLKRFSYEEELFFMETDNMETHNFKMEKLAEFYTYPQSDMLIIDKGRSDEERSVVLIEKDYYKGFCFVPQAKETDIHFIKDQLIPFRENPDIQQIIRNYLRKHKQELKLFLWNKDVKKQPSNP